MRSKLFVPGARPELFDKAQAGAADVLSFDLEDSVPEAGKAAARVQVGGFLRRADVAASGRLLIVRCNGTDTAHFAADLAAVALPSVWLLNLPKVESVAQVHQAVAMLERAEAGNGVARPIGSSCDAAWPSPRDARSSRSAGDGSGSAGGTGRDDDMPGL